MPEINPELGGQIAKLSAMVHELLDGPDGDGQLTGKMETQRVVLDVPRAFIVLATFMATFEPEKNQANEGWTHPCDEGRDIDCPAAKRLMKRYLERVLSSAMGDELHWLATHWFLTEPEGVPPQLAEAKSGKPAGDDDLPF